MSGILYEIQEYANMLREREYAMENGAHYNELGEAECSNRPKTSGAFWRTGSSNDM